MQKKDYLNFIAYLQIIGIILVVLGHSCHEYPDGHYGTTMLLYRACYSFRMPLFLFVSGFLMIYTTDVGNNPDLSPKKFFLNKVKRLLLPMMFLTTITFLPRNLMSFAADDSSDLNLHSFFMSFIDVTYMPIPYFWFLHVSFILLTVSFFSLHYLNKINISPKFAIFLLLFILIFYSFSSLPTTTILSINEIKRIGFFFTLGVCYAIFYQNIDSHIPWTRWWFITFCIILWSLSFFLFEKTVFVSVCSFWGIMMWISIAKLIDQKKYKFLDHLKGANYIIFLLSWFLNVLFQQLLSQITDFPWWIYSILSLIAGVYVPWYAYKYMLAHKNSRWVRLTALLLGQKLPKESI